MKRWLVAVLVFPLAVVGCSDDSASKPGVPTPAKSPSAASEPVTEVPTPSASAIAAALVRDGQVVGRVGVARQDISYVVRGTCRGVTQMAYRVLVAGAERSAGTWNCGTILMQSALSGADGQVQVEFVSPPSGVVALVEVVPEPS